MQDLISLYKIDKKSRMRIFTLLNQRKSYPFGNSVNTARDRSRCLSWHPFLLTLPTINTITHKVMQNGKGSLLYIIDLKRAFRHAKLNPKDYNLLGLYLAGAYLDSSLNFGFNHASNHDSKSLQKYL